MSDKEKTKEQITEELQRLRQRVAELQTSEAEHKRAEETYRTLVEHSLQGLVIVQDFRIVFANPAFAEISGYTVEELLSLSPEEVRAMVHLEDQALVWGRFRDRLEGKPVPPRYEYRGIRKDGAVRWLEMSTSRTEYHGKPAIQGAIVDITEHKRAEAEIIQLNRELTTLNRVGQALISTLDLQETLTIITDHTTQLLGVAAASVILHDEVKGGLWFAAASGKGAHFMQSVRLALGQGIAGWVVQHSEPVIVSDVSKDPRWFGDFDKESGFTTGSVLCVPLQTKGQTIGAIEVINKESGTFDQEDLRLLTSLAAPAATAIETARLYDQAQQEITDRKQAQEEIHRLSQFQESIIDNANIWLDVLDEKGNVVIWNKAAEEISGYFREDVVGRGKIWEWLYPDEEYRNEVFAEAVAIIEEGREEQEVETTIRRKDGRTRVISWNSRTLVDEVGNPIGSIALGRDITEHKQAEAELERLLTETKNLAHELAVLNELGQALTARLGVEEVLEEAYRQAARLVDTTNFYIALYDPEKDEITFPYTMDSEENDWSPLKKGEGLTGRVVETGKPLLLPIGATGFHREAGGEIRYDEVGKPALSWLGVPLMIGEQVLGVMAVQSYTTPDLYDEHDRDLLTAIAGPTAIAIQNARLFEETQARAEELAALREVNLATLSTLERDQVFEIMLDQLGRVIDYDTVAIKIITPDGRDKMIAGRGPVIYDQAMWAGFDVKDSKLVQEMKETGQTVVVHDAHTDERYARVGDWQAFPSWVGAPLFVRDDFVGYLMVEKTSLGFYDEHAAQLLGDFAHAAAIALENARLYEDIQRELAERKLAEAKLERRAVQLQAAAEVSRATTSILNPEELMRQVVDLVHERFALYFVGLFLLDEKGHFAVLRAGTGEAGRKMLEAGHKLKVGGESMIGWCTANAQARIALDVGEEAVRFSNPLLPETRSEMALPLVSRGQVVGAMTIQSAQPAAFSAEDTTVLQTMADQLANAIENSRLFEEEKRRATQLALVNEVSEKASSILDLDRLMQGVTRSIQEKFNYYHVSLFLLDEERREVVMQAATGGFEPTATRGYRQSLDEGIIGFVVRTGKSRLANDVSKDPYYIKGYTEVVIGSELCVPVKVGDKIIGALDMQSIRLNDFDQKDIVAIEAIADQVAIAIENARLFEETQARAKELAVLNEMGRALTKMLDVDAVIKSLYQYVSRLIDTTNFYVALYHPEQNEVSFPFYAEGELRRRPERRRVRKGMTEYVIRTSGSLLIEENVTARLEELGIELIGQEAQSWLGVPMTIGEQVIGVIAAQSYTTPRLYNEHHRDLLSATANQAAIAIENARLFEQIQTRAERERAIREISDQMQRATDMETLMRITAEGLNRALGGSRAYVRLGTETELVGEAES